MTILPNILLRLLALLGATVLIACSGESTQNASDPASGDSLAKDTPFAYVERSVNQTTTANKNRFQQSRSSNAQTPLELFSPYTFSPGAKLYVRNGIDVNALTDEILTAYFGSSVFDVKDLNVSADGQRLIFAAHGPVTHPTDYTWNIYEYEFEAQAVRRIIEDHQVANEGHDTNPTYTQDGNIVFSSDRAAGNPNSPVPNVVSVEDEEYCYIVGPKERPSLLHSMTDQGQDILQLTYGINHDILPTTMKDGRIAFVRWAMTYEVLEDCPVPTLASRMSAEELLKADSTTPFSLSRPGELPVGELCEYAESTPVGKIIASNNYTLLRITPDGTDIDQLYRTVTIQNTSHEQFLSIDRIVQAENGRLVGLLKHKFNDALGGDLVEFQSPDSPSGSNVFGNAAPRSLVSGGVALYPGQLSENGWYSALWPYRDGSSDMMVSYARCLTENNGVNGFCDNVVADNGADVQYGLSVFNAAKRTSSPIVYPRSDVVFDDVALSRPHVGLEFPFEPYNRDYVDNLDTSQIICNYPDPVNTPPLANAGQDQSVYSGSSVALDGSASSDVDGDVLTYSWTVLEQPAGSSVSLSDATAVAPSFDASAVGNYRFQLVVNDGEADSAPDTVTVIAAVEVVNQGPTANAGADQAALVGTPVTLDGSASSDPDGDTLTYQWRVISPGSISGSALTNASDVSPTFTPPAEGAYVIELVVNDGQLASAPDTVTVTAAYPNRAPVAEAGNNQQVSRNTTVTLDGSGSSDPDGDALSYQWSVVSPSGAVLSNAATAAPSITVTQFGTYTLQLIVNDGQLSSAPDTVSIEVINDRPVANAGNDASYDTLDPVALDGSASYDPEGEPLTYAWRWVSIPDGSGASLSNTAATAPGFTPDVAGNYVAELIVNDGLLDSTPDQVTVTITLTPNTAPVANAGVDQQITMGGTVTLDGSASSDADGDPLTYLWSVVSPAGITLTDPTSVRPTLDINQFGSYTVQLIVNDGQVDSAPDTVNLEFDNVKPVADAGPDQAVSVGTTAVLDGSGSTDVNGDILSYRWQLVEQPTDSTATLVDSQSLSPTLTIDQQGAYVVELIVNDGLVDSDPDRVVITSPNTPPVADAGNDASVSLGATAPLDGSGSTDADGDTLTYVWSLLSSPAGSSANLTNATEVMPTLQGIDVHGDYVAQLIVNDGTISSAPDTVIISTLNLPPVADAGTDFDADAGQEVALDGSGSYDPEGDNLSYNWSIIAAPDGSTAALTNDTTATPNFTPDVAGQYVAQLIVNDGQLNSSPDTVKIRASDVSCVISDVNERTFDVTIRDFQASHPDFEAYQGFGELGIVEEDLGSDGLPVYAHGPDGSQYTSGVDAFNQWYRDVDGINLNVPLTLTMTRDANGVTWRYENTAFFPINDDLLEPGMITWGNTPIAVARGLDRNYHFTMEVHLQFDYQGGESFTFTGDDDLWVFINGKLAIDLGGVHPMLSASIDLDEQAEYLGITPGNSYTFDLFFAERHLSASNFSFETSINLDCLP